MLLQFEEAKQSQIIGGQQNPVPNLELHNPMVLIIVSYLSLLCTLYNSLVSSNYLLHPNNELSNESHAKPLCQSKCIWGLPDFAQKQVQLERTLC